MLKDTVQPSTNAERLKCVRKIALTLGTEIPWLCDTMDSGVAHALGGASNAEFLIDPEGRVISSRAWCDPDALRNDLERLVGRVENPTKPGDLDRRLRPPAFVFRDGVRRLAKAADRRLLMIDTLADGKEVPACFSLEAEGDEALLQTGSGTLRLRLDLDPGLCWNNLAGPVTVQVVGPDEFVIAPAVAQERGNDATDTQPREFVLRAESVETDAVRLSICASVCNRERGWCRAVERDYLIHLEQPE